MGRVKVIIIVCLLCCRYAFSASPHSELPEGLIVVDTLNFNYQGNYLHLVDYDYINQRFLGLDMSDRKILEFNGQGDLIYTERFSRVYGKNSNAKSVISLAYLDDGSKILESNIGYFFFDSEWQIIDSLLLKNEFRYKTYPFPLSRKSVIDISGNAWENRTGFVLFQEYSKDFFEKTKILRTLNLKTGQWKDVLNFPKSTSLISKQQLYQEHVPLLINSFDKKELYMFFYMDPMIYTIDPVQIKIKDTKELNLQEFSNNSGIDFNHQSNDVNPAYGMNEQLLINMYSDSRITNVLPHQNGYIVFYFPGYGDEEKSLIRTFSDAQERKNQKSEHMMALFSRQHTLIQEVSSPIDLKYVHSVLSISSDRFIVKMAGMDTGVHSREKWQFLIYQIK